MRAAAEKEGNGAIEKRRRRLWELADGTHCSIVGTCLSMRELVGLLRKGRVPVRLEGASDHQIHGTVVRLAADNQRFSRLVHKALDRKYTLALRRFARAKDVEEVAALWDSAREAGDIPGAYWAGLTHPATDDALRERMFGEVHMLSHLVGAANRADIRRLQVLERDKAALEEKVARQQARIAAMARAHQEERDGLVQRLEAAEAECARLRVLVQERRETAAEPLAERLRTAENRRQAAEARLRRAEGRAGELARLVSELESRARQAEHEAASLERALAWEHPQECGRACRGCGTRPDLCGRCILYVGGHPRLAPGLRRLVERCNGTLCLHDGGREDAPAVLDGLLQRADVIFFPADCVSHEATTRIKRLCRVLGKPYVPLRRAGLGAFAEALERFAAPLAQAAE